MPTHKTLLQAKTELLALKELPKGYRIDCDWVTDSLLVSGPRLGFAVTRKTIDEGNHVFGWIPTLAALVKSDEEQAQSVMLSSFKDIPFG